MPAESAHPALHWDIFCRVIDNYGDIGVCWRLACNLAERGQQVRLWIDDASALAWMAPEGMTGVEVRHWQTPLDMAGITPGEVLVEAFGCEPDAQFVAAYAQSLRASGRPCRWLNLEYLSAEDFATRCHGLPSPVMSGPGKGLLKHFFYPGFNTDTGGLLRENGLLARQQQFDRARWLASHAIPGHGERLLSLFCYEPPALDDLLTTLAQGHQPTRLLVTDGRANAWVAAALCQRDRAQPLWNSQQMLRVTFLPRLTQRDYDHLLWACDMNFVRGEDSLVRALWAGKPLVWQIYPQDDGAHEAKLHAFLDWLQVPVSLREFHLCWNGLTARQPLADIFQPEKWRSCLAQARLKLLHQEDLANKLLVFLAKRL